MYHLSYSTEHKKIKSWWNDPRYTYRHKRLVWTTSGDKMNFLHDETCVRRQMTFLILAHPYRLQLWQEKEQK